MGTDIHFAVQRKLHGVWTRVKAPRELVDPYWLKHEYDDFADEYYKKKVNYDWYSDRNYNCFAILADVRNGFGFAGVDTGDTFVPISLPRGIPDDLGDEIDIDEDLGEHSFSWLLLSEILAYNWDRTIKNRGVIKLKEFIKRIQHEDTSWPESYCDAVVGPGIITLPREEAITKLQGKGIVSKPKTKIYVQEEWESTYAEAAGRFYTEIIPALQKLDSNPDNVRIVFGFDS